MTLARERARAGVRRRRGRHGSGPRPRAARPASLPLLRALDAVAPAGKTDLARAVDQVLRRSARPGLLAVVSDFFDAGPVLDAIGRAAQSGHDVVLVQIAAPDEIEPALEGDWALEDAETGEIVELTMDAATLEAYALRFAGLCEELRALARRHHATYVRARTDEPLEGVARRIVARSVD